MENTVTISLEEFDKLRKGFNESKTKIKLEKQLIESEKKIKDLEGSLKQIIYENFVKIEIGFSTTNWNSVTNYYFLKDKTPNWVKRFFNSF
jgi:hypothetical protein